MTLNFLIILCEIFVVIDQINHANLEMVNNNLEKITLYVEVLVVVDESLNKFHGKKFIQNYILTQMSIVRDIYQHDSLGVNVDIAVSSIIFINSTRENMVFNNDVRTTLESFCSWANNIRNNSQIITDMNFDIALYLTKENFGPAGYASVNGMCVKERGCAIIKDDGASSAFVIAHEIGHIFGMIHDGFGNNCSSDPSDGRIMASMVQSNYNQFFWSKCSKDVILNNLNKLHCLHNKPTNQLLPEYSQPVGQYWSLDEQCRQEFGEEYSLCKAFEGTDPCNLLWCGIGFNSTLCKTKRGPPLTGTKCDKEKWCIKNECKSKSFLIIDGNWSLWSTWSSCSKSCNFGVRYRSRSCSNPMPRYGGKECLGDQNEYYICKIESCLEIYDWRTEQCSIHDNKAINEKLKQHWIPLEISKNNTEVCKLTCISKETGIIFTNENYVIDGTTCSYDDEHYICINGICKEIGCDGIFNSSKRYDLCGKCGGNSSECLHIKEYININSSIKEYIRIAKIPSSAKLIKIKGNREELQSNYNLAIKDIITKEWILNERNNQSYNLSFVSRGTYFKLENKSIYVNGPLKSPIEIYVLLLKVNSFFTNLTISFNYSYFISKEKYKSFNNNNNINLTNSIRFKLIFNGWSKCSKSCDTGFQIIQMACIDDDLKRIALDACSTLKQNITKRECNLRPCFLTSIKSLTTISLKKNDPYWWQTKEWSSCSVSCGKGGYQSREVNCVTKDSSDKIKAIQPIYCNLRNIPPYIQMCVYIAC